MENKYSYEMTKRTDSQLIEIVTKFRDDYEVEALSAAEFEISKRNLSSEDLKDAKDEIIRKEKVQNEVLSSGEKLRFKLFGWYPGTWTTIALLEADGKIKKSEQARESAKVGCIVGAIIFGFLLLILNIV